MRIAFIDVETTGLTEKDRIVSLGLIVGRYIEAQERDLGALHLIFNPTVKSHPRARAVHGYSDAMLARQPLFATQADLIKSTLADCDLLVAHNAEFDFDFLAFELSLCGLSLPNKPTYCTMTAWRRAMMTSGRLDDVISQLNLPPRQGAHSALLDAFYCYCVYRWLLHKEKVQMPDEIPEPFNLVE